MKHKIKQLLRENITSGNVIVYHRTGKLGNSVKEIANNGYRIGGGAMYGPGVYTTYDLESQLNENMVETYGDIIIENKVLSMDKFLIFDYDIAKLIYGEKNYTLDKQLNLILGKKWGEYKNNKEIINIINSIPNNPYTSKLASSLINNFIGVTYLNGLVFTGYLDGKVLICFDKNNILPIRCSYDEGNAWVNILNKNRHSQIVKNDEKNTDIKYTHFLNAVESMAFNLESIDYLFKNINKIQPNHFQFGLNEEKLRAFFNNIYYYEKDTKLFKKDGIYLDEAKDRIIINFLLNDEFLKSLDKYKLGSILHNSSDKNMIIDYLLSNKIFYNNLDSETLIELFKQKIDVDYIFNKLGEKAINLVNNFNENQIGRSLQFSQQPDILFDYLGEKGIDFIKGLDKYNIGFYTSSQVNQPQKLKSIFTHFKLLSENIKPVIKQLLRERLLEKEENYITPPNIPNTMNFWHGGNLNEFNDVISQKNGRYEFGPGLYLITHHDTAMKYAKGSRKLYLISVEKGVDLSDAMLDINAVMEFIKTFVVTSMKKVVIERLQRFITDNKIKAYNFNVIMLNEKAIKPSNTKFLRQFYIDNGIDYELVDNPFGWGETMMVLYNMEKIVNAMIIKPSDRFKNYDLSNETEN